MKYEAAEGKERSEGASKYRKFSKQMEFNAKLIKSKPRRCKRIPMVVARGERRL